MTVDTAKYRKIFEHLRSEIRDGRYPRGVSRPKRLSVVDVEELGKARKHLRRLRFGFLRDCLRRRAHPLSEG